MGRALVPKRTLSAASTPSISEWSWLPTCHQHGPIIKDTSVHAPKYNTLIDFQCKGGSFREKPCSTSLTPSLALETFPDSEMRRFSEMHQGG